MAINCALNIHMNTTMNPVAIAKQYTTKQQVVDDTENDALTSSIEKQDNRRGNPTRDDFHKMAFLCEKFSDNGNLDLMSDKIPKRLGSYMSLFTIGYSNCSRTLNFTTTSNIAFMYDDHFKTKRADCYSNITKEFKDVSNQRVDFILFKLYKVLIDVVESFGCYSVPIANKISRGKVMVERKIIRF
ncbi:MAG: hypothetical protein EXX96DRAFT_612593 [Benjaminiella poitrasii]|nr:MAG: hypothetical protein EXX96DRAFT_612593 [Benjaminiella poitrasii]